MHPISALLFAILFLTFTGCEDKKSEQNAIPVENTTVIVMQEIEKTIEPETIHKEPKKNVTDTFGLFDMQKESYTATVTQKGLLFKDNTKPIVLVQFFATWCTPCIGEIAYLNDLQEENEESLFVTGILSRDTIDTSTLNTFTKEHHINYKILHSKDDDTLGKYIAQELGIQDTFPIPLIVIYLKGKYYTHYEGSVPVEMVKYDIKQAKQQLQNNEV